MELESMAARTEPGQDTLQASYAYCQEVTRTAAGNFYYGLRLLPKEKRDSMYALYAYMRKVDDIVDGGTGGPDAAGAELEAYKAKTHAVIAGAAPEPAEGQWWPAFADCARKHAIPVALFDAMIAGQRQDMLPTQLATFDQLYEYCYRVASVVGLASIYVWGFLGGQATESLAIDRGVAFQLTNILRDVREDALRGRCYIPAAELREHGVSPEDFKQTHASEPFLAMMRAQIARTNDYYARSAELESFISPDSRATLRAMTRIDRGILDKIAAEPGVVLRERVRLGRITKLGIAWRAWAGQ